MTDPTDLLAPPPPTPPDPARQMELLRLTARHLPRPRPWRRIGAAGALLAAGIVVGWMAKPEPAARVERVEVPVEVRIEVPVRVEVPAPSSGPVAAKSAPPTPERLELDAELATDAAESARLYRAAGDAFLAPRGDYAEAARCYRLSLRTAAPAERRVTAADSWLLARMKVSITQEVSP